MKISMRILMGILFPFILILTVTTISKALKPEKTQLNKHLPTDYSSETNPNSTDKIPVSFVNQLEKVN